MFVGTEHQPMLSTNLNSETSSSPSTQTPVVGTEGKEEVEDDNEGVKEDDDALDETYNNNDGDEDFPPSTSTSAFPGNPQPSSHSHSQPWSQAQRKKMKHLPHHHMLLSQHVN